MNLELSKHARRRMRKRRVTADEIIEVINNGIRRLEGTTKEGYTKYRSTILSLLF